MGIYICSYAIYTRTYPMLHATIIVYENKRRMWDEKPKSENVFCCEANATTANVCCTDWIYAFVVVIICVSVHIIACVVSKVKQNQKKRKKRREKTD